MNQRNISRTPRVGVFIDESLLNAAREAGLYLDFAAIMKVARSLGSVVNASAHLSHTPYQRADDRTHKVCLALRHAGFRVDLKPRGLTGAGLEKSRVGVDLAFSIARVALQHSLDIVCVGTDDPELANVIREVERFGTKTLLICLGSGTSSRELMQVASTYVAIDELSPTLDRELAYSP